MKEIRLASKIIKTFLKDSVRFHNRLWANILIIIGRLVVLLGLYYYVYKLNGGVINGTTYQVVAWSMFLYFVVVNFNLRQIARLIMQDVKSGNIEIILSKPVNYLFYKIWWKIGMGLYNFLFIGILGTLTMIFLVGIPDSMKISIFLPTFAIALLLTLVLNLLIYSIVGVIAFWVEDINPIFWIIDKFIMILGGSYLPVGLFPIWLYTITIYSPFGASMFITSTVYDKWETSWLMMLGMQIFWIIVTGLLLYLLFNKAKKKISVNGG